MNTMNPMLVFALAVLIILSGYFYMRYLEWKGTKEHSINVE